MHQPPPLELSDFGRKLGGPTGIGELMQDLGEALALNPRRLMMGGGNPARIPAMEAVWRRRMTELLGQGDAFERMLGHYDQPRGSPDFIAALVQCLNLHGGRVAIASTPGAGTEVTLWIPAASAAMGAV